MDLGGLKKGLSCKGETASERTKEREKNIGLR